MQLMGNAINSNLYVKSKNWERERNKNRSSKNERKNKKYSAWIRVN